MKITLLGSLGNINRIVAPKLITDGHEVTVITSQEERIPAIEALGAKAAVGSMADVDFLTEQFSGRDVVYLMIATGTGEDLFTIAKSQADIFTAAIQKSGVKNVVNLSSIGADAGEQAGALYAYHIIENTLRSLTDTNIAFLRPTGFYNNLFAHLNTIKDTQTIYTNIPGDTLSYYVDPADIADVVYPLITNTPPDKTVHYALSDMFTLHQFAEKLKAQLGWDNLNVVEITDEQYKSALLANHVPEKLVDAFIKMSQYQRSSDKIYDDLKKHNPSFGNITIDQFVTRYAQAILADSGDSPKARTIVS
ncbi:NAD(P)H-binding protein [Listeria sp. FSL L7-1582]|uniref:SDR family oxidoreductase n=1 Tax=Listeria portnoyi TaxID=2713504 RepID=UPI00164E1E7B|nr:NAD(P)H-binding protein [Listeria portnoyi]MBC6310417.1 NAD(P)H-binding protein [Listeria portnoyi]